MSQELLVSKLEYELSREMSEAYVVGILHDCLSPFKPTQMVSNGKQLTQHWSTSTTTVVLSSSTSIEIETTAYGREAYTKNDRCLEQKKESGPWCCRECVQIPRFVGRATMTC
jgi:hypothetical protein